MKSDISGKKVANKEEQRRMRHGLSTPPQLTIDPERRRDFFNRLLEKYSTKSTKVSSPPGSGVGPRSARFPSVPPTKTTNKLKDKFLKKKKLGSDKCVIKSAVTEDSSDADSMEAWVNSVRNHVFDPSVYKNHVRIRARSPFTLPVIEEVDEPDESEDEISSDNSTTNDSFTLLPCGDQKHRGKDSTELQYEEKIIERKMTEPEELQKRHITKSPSGTLIWVGNNAIHNSLKKKTSKKVLADNAVEKEAKPSKDSRVNEDIKSSGEGEDRPLSKKSAKAKRSKVKKNASALEFDESSKSTKPVSQEAKSIVKPSSSSLPQLSQDDSKSVKKFAEKVKKPKKLSKKQPFTVVTSKPT